MYTAPPLVSAVLFSSTASEYSANVTLEYSLIATAPPLFAPLLLKISAVFSLNVTVEFPPTYNAPPSLSQVLFVNVTVEFPLNSTLECAITMAPPLSWPLLLLKINVVLSINVTVVSQSICSAPPTLQVLFVNTTMEFPSNLTLV